MANSPGRVFILIFHGIGQAPHPLEPGEQRVWNSLPNLCSVLDAAAQRHDVRLTFDDGNRSDHELALPELLARGLQATFFVAAGRIGQPGYLDAGAIRDLVDAGMNVQSHGMHHRLWRGLDGEGRHEELVRARARLRDVTRRSVDEVAIPFCLYDRRVLRALRAEGYRRVYTCDGGATDPNAWLQARTEISRGEDGRRVAGIINAGGPTRAKIGLKKLVKRWR